MSFPWLLALGAIGWTVIGVLVALVVGRFIRGIANTPLPHYSSAGPTAGHRRHAVIE